MVTVNDLFEAERHEPLTDSAWDADAALATIRAIAAHTEATFDEATLWPNHVLDTEGASDMVVFKSLYFGAAGALWTLDYLSRQGAVELARDYEPIARRLPQLYRDAPDLDLLSPSYHLGEVGVALIARQIAGDTSLDTRLYELIRDNIEHPALEPLWGGSGRVMAAEVMYERTGETRWRDVFNDTIEHYLTTWHEHPEYGCRLWTQDMYGHQVKHIGPGHGFAGNVQPALRRADWLSAERRDFLYRECARTLKATAVVTDEYANWPQSVGVPRPGRTAMLVQWCHGSPGMICAFSNVPTDFDADVEELLRRGGELTWNVGPLSKGYGLCHGTAGNGYCFLELFHRTGEARWLDRARAFAVHSVAQMERMRLGDSGRFSLWTGDLGLAVYLWHCLHPDLPRSHYPLQQPPV